MLHPAVKWFLYNILYLSIQLTGIYDPFYVQDKAFSIMGNIGNILPPP